MTRERLLFPAPLRFQDSRYEPRKWLFLFGSFWTATRSCSDTEVTSSAKKLCLFCCEFVQFSLLSATQCASGGSSHQGSSRATRLSSAPCETWLRPAIKKIFALFNYLPVLPPITIKVAIWDFIRFDPRFTNNSLFPLELSEPNSR